MRPAGAANATDEIPSADWDLVITSYSIHYTKLYDWLKVKAVGSGSNKDAIGTRIELYNGDQLLAVREVGSATGFCAQEPLVQHFGVKAGDSYRVKVLFPSGKEVAHNDIRAGQTLRVEEPN